ncbi:peptidoglycan/LPS O-acetylase OafA/YrhL [Curtobacterium luteum]|uniref:Acyltransferase n=1 Tax=Curtobacterium luteum TaxID=33881 RepID=A0A8H9KZ73_9MICO|nr:acyltransferase family protein [Curtobacterium luteum]MBM7803820.1 peptidoglycan/LPS O-acetylase OafA/YrhL [Curtobacterium luteum]NUU51457.1 acyltransferase [Curtobacterium luteum]GGL02288.1 acyltransferase [Curtobacterium luteum]
MTSSSPAFRNDVHGLRGGAVLLVLLEHARLAFGGGFVGVDVFFVISGFLITGHVVRELERRGRVDLAGFWARRVRRILPSALLVALVTAGVGLLLVPPLARGELVEAAVASLLSVPNLYFASEGTDYLAGTAPSPFQHYWSLGVEEQFYLLWPLFLLLAWRLGRRSSARRRTMLLVGAVVVLVALSLALAVGLTDRSQPWAFFSLPSRAWELAAGGLAAIAVHRGALVRGHTAVVLGWAGLAGILLAATTYSETTAYPGTAVLLPVAAAVVLVWSGAAGHPFGPVALLGIRPLQYLGGISYALYLWHWPLLVLPQAAVGLATPLPLWVRLTALAAAVGLAHLTTRYVEQPLRGARLPDVRTVLLGLSASAVAVAVVLGAGMAAAPRTLTSDRTTADVTPTEPPTFTPFVPVGLDPQLDRATDSTSDYRRRGCHVESASDTTINSCVLGDPDGTLTVALVGDSHAAHWMPALEAWADRHGGVRVLGYTKNACTMVDVEVLTSGRPYRECDTWRAGVLQRLAAEAPDVVLVAGSAHLPLAAAPDESDRAARTTLSRDGLRRTLAVLPERSRVSVLADTPEFAESVPRCLSANLDDTDACGVDRHVGVDAARVASERRVTEAAGHRYVDLTDWFCSPTRCGVVSGNTLLYRDHGHLTEPWARSLWRQIGAAVEDAR